MLDPEPRLLGSRNDLSTLPSWLRWMMVVAAVGAVLAIVAVIVSGFLPH
jgi:hypothetical protein